MKSNICSEAVRLVAFGLLLVANCPVANAATRTWQGPGSDFNTAANWSGGLPGATDLASFAGATPLAVNISAPISINQLGFTTAGIGYDLTSGSGNSIQLTLMSAGTGSGGAISAANASGTNTVDSAVFLGATAGTVQQFSQTAGGTLILSGQISGNAGNGISLNTGTFTVAGANTFTGNASISGSAAQANVTSLGNSGAAGNLGAGAAINIYGTLNYTGAGETTSKGINIVGSSSANTGASINGSGAGALNISGAITTVTNSTAKLLNLGGASTAIQNEISGNVTDGTAVLKISVNGGQWALSGSNNAYTGGGVVTGGSVLDINGATALGTGAWSFSSGATFDNTTTGNLALTTNNALTFNSTTNTFTGTHSLDLGTGAVTIGGSALVLSVNANTLTVGGAVGDAGLARGFAKSGAGTLVLNGNNTYTGTTTLNAGTLILNGNNSAAGATSIPAASTGTLVLGSPTAVGGGTFLFNGGTLTASTDLGGANAIANAVSTTTSGATSTISGSNNIQFNGAVSANVTRAITNNLAAGKTLTLNGGLSLASASTNFTTTINGAGNTVIPGVVSGGTTATAGSLTKSGAGTLTLAGTNTYGGLTTISAGTLLANNATTSTGTGAVSVTAGTLGGSGRVQGVVTVASGATLLGGDGATAVGMLTLAINPTLTNGAIIGLTLDAANAHSTLALAAGGFNGFATTQPFTLGGLQAGTYDNIITGVAMGITTTGWTITNGSGFTYSFVDDNLGNIDLNVAAVPEPSTWVTGMFATAVGLYHGRRRIFQRAA